MIPVFRPHLRAVRRSLALGMAASVATALLQLASPWPLKFIFDSVLSSRPLPSWLSWLPHGHAALLGALSAAMVVIAVVLAATDYLSNRLVATAGQQAVFELRSRLFRHIEMQRSAFHQRRTTGDLLARLGGDVQAIQSAVVTAVPTLTRNSLTLVGMVVIMLAIAWRFTLLSLAVAAVLFWITRAYLRRIKLIQRLARRADGEASSIAQEVLVSMPVVQAFGAEDHEARRYSKATRRGLEANRRAIVAQSELTPMTTLALTVSTVLVLFYGAQGVIHQQLTPGDLLVFMAYLKGMYSPMRQLAKLAGVVARAQAAAERVAEILLTHEEVPELASPRPLGRPRGVVTLNRVSFSYPSGPQVLQGVELEVPAGTSLALVGATGSGKSTLLRLIPRFFDPTSGSVRLDGLDVRQFPLADLRRQIAYVPQETYLFQGTIWENILYGSGPGNQGTAIAAAKRAGVHDVFAALEDGYDTVIGQRGLSLSGGQRQCLAVSRAMARQAPILLLDEPTVGLDRELEAILVAALDRLRQGRTTIVVSHQQSTVSRCDRTVVLEGGRIPAGAAPAGPPTLPWRRAHPAWSPRVVAANAAPVRRPSRIGEHA